MIPLLLLAAVVVVPSLVWMIRGIRSAPEGREDKGGFHRVTGVEPDKEADAQVHRHSDNCAAA